MDPGRVKLVVNPDMGTDLITKSDPELDACGFRLYGTDPGSGRFPDTWTMVVLPESLILRVFLVMLPGLVMAWWVAGAVVVGEWMVGG